MNDDDDPKKENSAQPMDPKPIDPKLIEALAEIATRQGLSEIEVRQDGLRIRVARQVMQQMVQVAPQPAAAPQPVTQPAAATPAAPAADHPGTVRSPMVGTVFLRPEPGADPFIQIGSAVRQGDKLMLVEAMKTFNDIVAPRDGTITAILINDGEPVEFGEPLVVIE